MKTCDKCGADNANNAKYCKSCGYKLPMPIVEEIPQPVVKPIKQRDDKKIVGKIIGAVVTFVMIYFAVQLLFFRTPFFSKTLMETANEINKVCPIMIDSETRLENTMALPKKVFQYNYTLINVYKEDINDIAAVEESLEQKITNFVRTSPDTKIYRDNNVTMKFCYSDRAGTYLFTITVTPDQYK
jgi:hypothetical protein